MLRNPSPQYRPWEELQPQSRACQNISIPCFYQAVERIMDAESPVYTGADLQVNMTWGEQLPLPVYPPPPPPSATALLGDTSTEVEYEYQFLELPGLRRETPHRESSPLTGTTSSLVNLGDSGNAIIMTPASTTNSYVMVHRRATSNGSSAEGSEHQGYSVPRSQGSAAEWANGGEMDLDEDNYREMPHDPNTILFNMQNPVHTPINNPYSPEPTAVSPWNGDSPASQDYGPHMQQNALPSANRSCAAATHGQNLFLPSRTSVFVHESPDGPWNHMNPSRVPPGQYGSGYTTFAPSPGPVAQQEFDELRDGAPGGASLQIIEYSEGSNSKASKKSDRKTKSRSPRPSSKAKGKGKAISHSWEHHSVIEKDGFALMTKPPERSAIRAGIRKGKLDPEAADKARQVRRLTACWNCWIQKVPCSIGKPCDRCKRQFSPMGSQVCNRSHFKEYEPVFYPEYLHSHFKKKKIEELLDEHTNGFLNTMVEVAVHTGLCFKPLRLEAHLFQVKTLDLLGVVRLAVDKEQPQFDGLVIQNSAPIGLMKISMSELKDKCKEHIEEMIENPYYAMQVTAGEPTRIPYAILAAAQQYSASADLLISQAMMLHGIHYYLKSFITLTEESARKVYPAMQALGAAREPYLSSRLLNRQIKYAMHNLSREITLEVLEGLERTMRMRTKDSWGIAFCAFLVLCLCMEGLQIASDTYVICDMKEAGANSVYNREESFAACRLIDELPFNQCKKLFHDIYRSHRESQRGREGGFNPLSSLANTGSTGLEHNADIMVTSIYRMISNSWSEILTLSNNPLLVNQPGFGFDPKLIKANGSGRLVAIFLKSFFPLNWTPYQG